MTDLKSNEKAMQMLNSLNVDANAISIAVKLKVGDTFTLTGMCKFNEFGDLVNLGYTTNIGARIATRNFLNVDLGEESPKVGNTAGENAVFCVYCVENEITFRVTAIDEEEREYQGQKYIRKTFHLEVVL